MHLKPEDWFTDDSNEVEDHDNDKTIIDCTGLFSLSFNVPIKLECSTENKPLSLLESNLEC